MSNPSTIDYCYRQRIDADDESEPRYVIPLGDPSEHESAFDDLFDTPEEATEHLIECIGEEYYGGALAEIRHRLVLVKIVTTPVCPAAEAAGRVPTVRLPNGESVDWDG